MTPTITRTSEPTATNVTDRVATASHTTVVTVSDATQTDETTAGTETATAASTGTTATGTYETLSEYRPTVTYVDRSPIAYNRTNNKSSKELHTKKVQCPRSSSTIGDTRLKVIPLGSFKSASSDTESDSSSSTYSSTTAITNINNLHATNLEEIAQAMKNFKNMSKIDMLNKRTATTSDSTRSFKNPPTKNVKFAQLSGPKQKNTESSIEKIEHKKHLRGGKHSDTTTDTTAVEYTDVKRNKHHTHHEKVRKRAVSSSTTSPSETSSATSTSSSSLKRTDVAIVASGKVPQEREIATATIKHYIQDTVTQELNNKKVMSDLENAFNKFRHQREVECEKQKYNEDRIAKLEENVKVLETTIGNINQTKRSPSVSHDNYCEYESPLRMTISDRRRRYARRVQDKNCRCC